MKRASLIILALLLTAPFAYAQSVPEDAGTVTDVISSGISLSLSPLVPGPDTRVTVSLEVTTVDPSVSTITWTIDGKPVAKGRGLDQVSFTTGAIGTKDTVTVTIASPDGTFSKSLTIEVGSVDLLWQGSGYTPPFYEGRTLWGHQTTATLVALPHVSASASNLIYRWSIDGEIQGASSGVGKSSFTLADSVLGNGHRVTVDVMSDRDTILATGSADLAPIAPKALVYELNPVLGYLFHREVDGTYALSDKEVSFSVFPFFFGALDRASTRLSYDWSTSGTHQATPTVTYRAPEGGEGSAAVSVSVSNKVQILETGEKDFLVQFNTNATR